MLECGVICQSADYLSVCVLGHYVLLAALSLPFSLWAAKLSLCFFFFFFFSLYSSCDWLLGSLSPEIALILSDKTEPASNPLLQSLPTHLSLSLSLCDALFHEEEEFLIQVDYTTNWATGKASGCSVYCRQPALCFL